MEKRDIKRKRVRLSLRAEPGNIKAYSGDLSETGIFIITTKVLRPGTRLRIIVNVDDGSALGVGIVRWAKRVPSQLIRNVGVKGGMGVEFTWVSTELRELINESLA
jgi:hypothetical protein